MVVLSIAHDEARLRWHGDSYGRHFEGIDDLIDRGLGVMQIGTTAPHYRHKSAALHLKSKPYSFDAHALFEKIGARMHRIGLMLKS